MAQLVRTGPSGPVDGVGHVRRGVIHTVPDHMVAGLLATGEWAHLGDAVTERVTEPAPAQPAARARARKTKK